MDDEIEELMGLDIGDNRTLAVGDTTGCIYCSIIQVDFRKHQKCLNRRDTLATTPIGHICKKYTSPQDCQQSGEKELLTAESASEF